MPHSIKPPNQGSEQSDDSITNIGTDFTNILENFHAAISITRLGIHYYGNKAYLALFGYTSNHELFGKPDAEQIAPAARKAYQKRIASRPNKHVDDHYETIGLRADGSEFPMEVFASTTLLFGKLYSVAFASDISTEKKNIATIRESQALLNAIVNSTSDYIWVVDSKSFALTFFNERLNEKFLNDRGIHLQTGMVPTELYANEELLQAGMQNYKRALAQGPFITEFRSASKSTVLKLHYTQLIQDNEITGIAVFGEDMTKDIEADRILREREELLSVLVENDLVGIYFVQDGNFAYANKTVASLFGYTPEELLGKDTLMLFHPDDRHFVVERRRQRAEGHVGTSEYELRGVRKDGTILQLSLQSSSAIYNNKPAVIVIMRDITQSKQAIESLRQSELMFRTLSENAQIGVYFVQDGLFTYANKTLAHMFGYEPDELIGCETSMLAHPDDWPIILENRRQRAAGIDQLEYEIRNIKKDGTICTVAVSASNIVYNGEPAVIVVKRDITNSKLADQAIRDSEERFRVLSENSLIGVYIAEGRSFTYVNDTLAAMFGYRREALIGRCLLELIHPDDRDRIWALRESFSADLLDKAACEARGLRLDGSVIYLDISFSAATIGNTNAVIGAIQDITDKHKAYEYVRESEEFFRTAFENANMGVIFVNLHGKLMRVNSRFCEITGYSEAELITMTFNDITHEDDMQIGLDVLHGLTVGSIQRASYEKRYIHKDGHTLWCQFSVGMVYDRENNPLYTVAYVQDITDQKRNEQMINESYRQLQTAAIEAIECLGFVVETRDPYTSGHQRRVADLAMEIAKEMNLEREQIDAVRIAGMVHDIGKMSIPAEILSKPTSLNKYERAFIEQHAESGFQILSRIHFPWPVAEIVYQHHERIDGSGYPLRLQGENMRIEAKILAVADVIEAMSTHRPYRAALGTKAALNEIIRYRGVQYDEAVVDACVRVFREKDYRFSP